MALKPLVLRCWPKLLVDQNTPNHSMRLQNIEQTGQNGLWSGASLSTTCVASESSAGQPPDHGIKVTTKTDVNTETRAERV